MASSAATTATFCATLVDEWVLCGVCHAVVSPGSRSTPMVLEIANRSEIETHIFHDERSASFAALGIAKASGVPAILLCTSGTAAVEFHPAVVEASYAEVPMLVCTADRPPELQGVGAPQTINQQGLYGDAVRKFFNADVADDSQSNRWRTIAREMFSAALGAGYSQSSGPAHLNLQFREPLVGVATALPQRNEHSPETIMKTFAEVSSRQRRKLLDILGNKRGLIIAGPETYRLSSVLQLAEHLGWPIFADPRSVARVKNDFVIAAFDSILRSSQFAQNHQPEVILRLGIPLVSKVTNTWLESSAATQVVLTTTQRLVDPERRTELHLVGEIDELFADVVASRGGNSDDRWITAWMRAEDAAQLAINEALTNEPMLTEPAIARALCSMLPESSHLIVSSSMPIRDVEWFGAPRTGLTVHANRGVNGIDGVVSTAVGVALATKEPTSLLIGDIAFLHDTNGLINLAGRKVDLRIVVIDNGGGGIFSFLPQASLLDESKFEKIFGTPHKVDITMLAKAHQIPAETISNLEEFAEAMNQRGPFLIRVSTDRSENVRVHERVNQMVSVRLQRI